MRLIRAKLEAILALIVIAIRAFDKLNLKVWRYPDE